MRFHNYLRDRQPHARAGGGVSLVSSAIELVEDQRLLEVIDPRSAVGNAGEQAAPSLTSQVILIGVPGAEYFPAFSRKCVKTSRMR